MIELLAGGKKVGETKRAIQACNDYLRLGPGRSLAKLLNRYQSGTEVPPTRRIGTLKTWSVSFGWQQRAAAYDTETERQKNEYAKQVMQSGLALDYERVSRLKAMADLLEEQILARENGRYANIWLADAKQIGAGEFAERVDIVRFNPAIFEQWRGIYDDLARETGGRKQEQKYSGQVDVVEMSLEEWKQQRRNRLAGITEMDEPECGTQD